MRVAIVNKGGSWTGGAGKMAHGLKQWLGDVGVDAEMFLAEHGEGVQVRGLGTKLLKSVEVRTLMNEMIPLDYPALRRQLDTFQPDVVHVHDISRAFSIDSIGLLARRYPTVWTLHDQSAITGGCISPFPCTRYETGCGECPKHGTWSVQGRMDLTAAAFRRRQRFFDDRRVILATPSLWASQRIQSSRAFGGNGRVEVVPNALPANQISHLSRAAARRKIGVPADRLVLVIISHDLNDVAKNPPSQREALLSLADLDPLILLMGNSNLEFEESLRPLEVRGLGFVTDPRIKRWAYGSADLFVNASMSDTFSLTTLEALAVGTPVVAYASGGIPEVLSAQCGVLVEPDDADALASAIRGLAIDGIPDEWSSSTRHRARMFSTRRHAHDYCALYRRAIEGFRAR